MPQVLSISGGDFKLNTLAIYILVISTNDFSRTMTRNPSLTLTDGPDTPECANDTARPEIGGRGSSLGQPRGPFSKWV